MNLLASVVAPCEAAVVIVRPGEPDDFREMQQLASRLWPSGWHPGGLGWGLWRHALADEVAVAVDDDGDGPIVGFAGRGGDEMTHVDRDRDDVADVLVTWLLEVDGDTPTWLYDPMLDLVAVAEDDAEQLAACCIAWFDAATGVCEIEPLGVAPEHRRRGLAVALCLEVANLVAERGGTQVFINAQPQLGYVAATSAYVAAGFDLVERATTYAARGGE